MTEQGFQELCKPYEEEVSTLIIEDNLRMMKKDRADFSKMSWPDLIDFADAYIKSGFPKYAIKILKVKGNVPEQYLVSFYETLLFAYSELTPLSNISMYGNKVFDCLLKIESVDPEHKLAKKYCNDISRANYNKQSKTKGNGNINTTTVKLHHWFLVRLFKNGFLPFDIR
jgi:hypothetical protein